MMHYSESTQKEAFIAALEAGVTPSRRPLFVLDLDGNALIGYNLTGDTRLLAAPDPKRNIPAGADIAALEREGLIAPALFAQKPLDARLPQNLTQQLNRLMAANRPYELAVLTSRSETDALQVLRDSGVQQPENVTLIADSGAVMRVDGQRRSIRVLSAEERAFLGGLDALKQELEPQIDALLLQHGLSAEGRPSLVLEEKGIASNLHFRSILNYYGLADSSAPSQDMTSLLERELEGYLHDHSPIAARGGRAFKMLHGPATAELKLADVDKGHGLHALTNHVLQTGAKPSAIVFAGDDVCNHGKDGSVSPGTDYFAFAALPEVQKRTGISSVALHVQHPQDETLDGEVPSPTKAVAAMAAPYDKAPLPVLTLRSPRELSEVVDSALTRCEARAQSIHARAERFRSGSEGAAQGR